MDEVVSEYMERHDGCCYLIKHKYRAIIVCRILEKSMKRCIGLFATDEEKKYGSYICTSIEIVDVVDPKNIENRDYKVGAYVKGAIIDSIEYVTYSLERAYFELCQLHFYPGMFYGESGNIKKKKKDRYVVFRSTTMEYKKPYMEISIYFGMNINCNVKKWYDTGRLKYSFDIRESKIAGKVEMFDTTGQPSLLCTIIDGQLDGEYKQWSTTNKRCRKKKVPRVLEIDATFEKGDYIGEVNYINTKGSIGKRVFENTSGYFCEPLA